MVNTTVPKSSGSTTNTDAAVAVSIIKSDPKVLITGGTITTTGTADFLADNKVNVSSTADGKQGGSDDSGTGGAGATLSVSVLWGDTSSSITGGTVNAGDKITVSATSDRTATTVSNATEGGSDPSGGGSNKSEQTLADPNPNKANDGKSVDKAKTSDGDLPFAAGIAVGVLTGDADASITGGSITATGGHDIAVTASNKHKVATTADGSKKTTSGGTAVGVAVAIQVTDSDGTASIGNSASLTAANVNLLSDMTRAPSTRATAEPAARASGLPALFRSMYPRSAEALVGPGRLTSTAPMSD